MRAVVTQNIDLLHTRAGSRDVVEVHGSISRFPCLACGGEETLAAILAQLETREAPLCSSCAEIVKPGVVMFGELLPAGAMERAERLARETGLLLVVGSSLQVWPVAGLPGDTVRAGGALAILNLEETPYDDVARDRRPRAVGPRPRRGRTRSRCAAPRTRSMAGMAATKNDTEKNDAAKTEDVITRLASKGEEAIRRIVDLPGGQRALEAFNELKLRVDDLSKKVRGVDELEQRVAKLEKEIAALKRAQKPASGS